MTTNTQPLDLETLKKLKPSWENLVKLKNADGEYVYCYQISEDPNDAFKVKVLDNGRNKGIRINGYLVNYLTLAQKLKRKVKKKIRYVSNHGRTVIERGLPVYFYVLRKKAG